MAPDSATIDRALSRSGWSEGLAQQGAELGTGLGVGQGQQHRQGVDALGQVLAGRLAQLGLGADHVEDVVPDLEDHPEASGRSAVKASTWSRGRPPVRAPIRHEVAISEAVLPAMALE